MKYKMKYLRSFESMNDDSGLDYDKMLKVLHKKFGWGNGSISKKDEFEENEDYYKNPSDEREYADQFNIYLTDSESGRLLNRFNNSQSLKPGNFRMGNYVGSQTSIYSKST